MEDFLLGAAIILGIIILVIIFIFVTITFGSFLGFFTGIIRGIKNNFKSTTEGIDNKIILIFQILILFGIIGSGLVLTYLHFFRGLL